SFLSVAWLGRWWKNREPKVHCACNEERSCNTSRNVEGRRKRDRQVHCHEALCLSTHQLRKEDGHSAERTEAWDGRSGWLLHLVPRSDGKRHDRADGKRNEQRSERRVV